jgi:hypothetical protein
MSENDAENFKSVEYTSLSMVALICQYIMAVMIAAQVEELIL